MNIPPDGADRARASIERQHATSRRERIARLEQRGADLAERARLFAFDLAKWISEVRAMRDEVRQAEDTTVCLPILKDDRKPI